MRRYGWCLKIMNKPFFLQKITRISLLIGLISISTVSYAGTAIDSTYAVKNLLTSITETYPNLTIQEALSQSALLGIMSEMNVQLHMYGTFTPQPDSKRPGRTMKVFDTTTNLNKITRTMLDVLDDKLRSTVQESNPFCALEGAMIAHIMQALTTGKDGIGDLAKLLQDPAFITTWSDDWDAKVNAPTDDPNQKKKYSLSEFKTKIKDFVKLLEALNKEAKTPTEKAKIVSDLAKVFMTFLSAKDQKQKATGESYAIEEYYTTLLNKPFESDYYTAEELEQIEKTLLGQDSTHTIGKDAKGVEDTSAYLAHFVAGDIAFLQSPSSTYEGKSKSFSYCSEATVHSIMNSLLYNPETGKLDITMLPLEIQKSMGKKFKDFIEKYPDPTVTNYYGNSLKEWLDLVSGLDGVKYKNGEGKDAYEISAGAGPKNLVTVLNHIFGTQSNSFEILATALEVKNEDNTLVRKVSFTPNKSGFDIEVTDHGQTVIQAEIGSEVNTSHASFAIKGKKILDLLNNKEFRSHISELSDYSQQDLYEVIFKPSTLNVTGDIGAATPLIQAIKSSYGTPIVKTMLAFGADPNFKGSYSSTPLEVAVFFKGNNKDLLIHELLKSGALVTIQAITDACLVGDVTSVKTFITSLEQNKSPIDFDELLRAATHSPYPSIPLVEFLLAKGADINSQNARKDTPLLNAIRPQGSSEMIQFLIEKGAQVTEEMLAKACNINELAMVKILIPLVEENASHVNYTTLLSKARPESLPLIELLLAKGADINCKDKSGETLLYRAIYDSVKKETTESLIAKYLIEHGAALTPSTNGTSLLALAIKKGRTDIIKLLLQHGAELTSDVLLDVINSQKFATAEKIELSKKILEKDGIVSTNTLNVVQKNAADTKSYDEKNRLEKKQWTELFLLLKQAYTEQSFGLYLTTQEQKCITECVREEA